MFDSVFCWWVTSSKGNASLPKINFKGEEIIWTCVCVSTILSNKSKSVLGFSLNDLEHRSLCKKSESVALVDLLFSLKKHQSWPFSACMLFLLMVLFWEEGCFQDPTLKFYFLFYFQHGDNYCYPSHNIKIWSSRKPPYWLVFLFVTLLYKVMHHFLKSLS